MCISRTLLRFCFGAVSILTFLLLTACNTQAVPRQKLAQTELYWQQEVGRLVREHESQRDEFRRQNQELTHNVDRLRANRGHEVDVVGPAEFHVSVMAVLDELRHWLPHRYREALWALPRVELNPQLLDQRHGPGRARADSSGVFRWTAFSENYGYAGFRHTYYHEIGHHVLPGSEYNAEAYAHLVEAELRSYGVR